MGQPVEVTAHPTLDGNVHRFETNRWLTGMGGHLYFRPDLAPPGAPQPHEGGYESRILELDGVETVYVYGSVVTVTKSDTASWDKLEPEILEILANSYRYYDSSSLVTAE